jgi:hypothetical protein
LAFVKRRAVAVAFLLLAVPYAFGQGSPLEAVNALKAKGLSELRAFEMLRELSEGIGPRLNGSPGAARAVEWGEATMRRLGFQNVRRQPCMVPQWIRGDVETCELAGGGRLTCCALGNSPATVASGVTAEVIEVKSLKEAEALGARARGKIIFFNRPFDPTLVSTFEAYGTAGDQRFQGPAVAAKVGAVAALVRSMTGDHDDVPHTGTTGYGSGPKIPAAALSLVAADRLSAALKVNPSQPVRLELNCETRPDVESANVIGEIVGSEKPNEVVVMGGHLDSWDKGRGAHDDGAGIVQALDALRVIRELGWRPKRTIRVVLWMAEENRGSGSKAYFEYAKGAKERHVAAIESDSGGFAPRGFGTSLKGRRVARLNRWLPAFRVLEADRITAGGETGADIDDLGALGTALFGLDVESQRYFDYHHSDKDTIDVVNPRELQLGSISMALLAWLIAENGV